MTVTENVILPAVTGMCEAVLDANVQHRLRNSFVEQHDFKKNMQYEVRD